MNPRELLMWLMYVMFACLIVWIIVTIIHKL
jgi:hypothetical protein